MDTGLPRTEPRTAFGQPVPVLIVEDDPDAREALKALVEFDGYQVHTAASAEQAKRAVAEHEPLCVIVDLGLPGASAVELAQTLRAQGHALVLIAVAPAAEHEDPLEAEAAGVDYLLHKPLDIERFRHILRPLH